MRHEDVVVGKSYILKQPNSSVAKRDEWYSFSPFWEGKIRVVKSKEGLRHTMFPIQFSAKEYPVWGYASWLHPVNSGMELFIEACLDE